MRSGPDQNKLVLIVAIDQAPVTLNMTAAIGFPRSLQRMIVIDWRKRNAALKLFDDRDELVHPVATACNPLQVFSILGSEGVSSPAIIIPLPQNPIKDFACRTFMSFSATLLSFSESGDSLGVGHAQREGYALLQRDLLVEQSDGLG